MIIQINFKIKKKLSDGTIYGYYYCKAYCLFGIIPLLITWRDS